MRKSAAALAALSIALACSTTDLSDLQGGEPDASGGSGGSAGSGDASAGSAGTSGSGASAGSAGQGGSAGVSGGSGASGNAGSTGADASATCENPYAGNTCADLSQSACADCAKASCCAEIDACFSNTQCGGLYQCTIACQLAEPGDPATCVEEQCTACYGGADLLNAFMQCVQNLCAGPCSA